MREEEETNVFSNNIIRNWVPPTRSGPDVVKLKTMLIESSLVYECTCVL